MTSGRGSGNTRSGQSPTGTRSWRRGYSSKRKRDRVEGLWCSLSVLSGTLRLQFCVHFFCFCWQAFPQKHGPAVGKSKQVGEHPKTESIAQVLCAFCSLTYRSISSRISFDKSILSSSPEYMSDLRRIAWYSPSLLTIPFMTLCMRVSMSWYNAESFSNPIPPLCGVVAYLCFGGIASGK